FHRLLRTLINLEMKNVRPRIVANNIQIIFSTRNLRAINLRRQNWLAAGVRSSEKIPERIDDATPSSRHDRIGISSKRRGIVLGKITLPVELIAGEHKATSLNRDMTH